MNLDQLLDSYGLRSWRRDPYADYSELVGKWFWICDKRLSNNDPNTYVRVVEPTLVEVDLGTHSKKGRVEGSPIFFRPVGPKGFALRKEITPRDKTGNGYREGISVQIFETAEECFEQYEKFEKECFRVKFKMWQDITKEIRKYYTEDMKKYTRRVLRKNSKE